MANQVKQRRSVFIYANKAYGTMRKAADAVLEEARFEGYTEYVHKRHSKLSPDELAAAKILFISKASLITREVINGVPRNTVKYVYVNGAEVVEYPLL